MTRPFAFAFVVLLAAGAGAPALQAAPADDAAIVHALNRLTYGPRPGDVERVKAMGLQKWIETQLAPSRIDDGALTTKLQGLETLTLDSETIQRDYAGPAMAERRKRAAEGAEKDTRATESTEGSDRNAMRGPMSDVQRKGRQVIADIEEAKLLRAVYSERQLEEVLVDFWFNHFNVFAGKGATRNYVSEYEREAIRPYVLGQFRDMLGATAKSPAMLFYLDNWLSSAQGAQGAQGAQRAPRAPRAPRAQTAQGRRSSGINENYARELLELHTLGVDGGYTQQDIVNVAKAFTGWTIQPRQGSGFMFVAARHERGEKVVLGQTIKAGGVDEGERVLDIVAAHPATARHIAKKLAMRFVSDNPPAALVDRAAARFTATRGDLREVLKVILGIARVRCRRRLSREGQDAARVRGERAARDRRRGPHRAAAGAHASRHGHAALLLPAADGLRRDGDDVGVGGRAGQPHELRGGSVEERRARRARAAQRGTNAGDEDRRA